MKTLLMLPVDSFVQLTLCCLVLAPRQVFLSALLSDSQMSSITSSSCWGFASCCRKSPGSQQHLLHPKSPPVSLTNFYRAASKNQQKSILLGSRE